MKKIFTMLALAGLMVASLGSCKDDKNKLWDPNATVSLRAANGVPSGKTTGQGAEQAAGEVNPKHLTAREIVKQANEILFWNTDIVPNRALGRGFADAQRDFVNNRLMMWGTDIITQAGDYAPDFIESKDVIIIIRNDNDIITDTIAYIPNKTLIDAQKIIKSAYDKGEYDAVYATFDNTFRFIPITGAEWLELKAQGKN